MDVTAASAPAELKGNHCWRHPVLSLLSFSTTHSAVLHIHAWTTYASPSETDPGYPSRSGEIANEKRGKMTAKMFSWNARCFLYGNYRISSCDSWIYMSHTLLKYPLQIDIDYCQGHCNVSANHVNIIWLFLIWQTSWNHLRPFESFKNFTLKIHIN